ncbi:MAG: hypothetical protein PHO41_10035, partial [Eubacteriales bacterium]|nr:hypothetical protein [Eubacteriales bacterium]
MKRRILIGILLVLLVGSLFMPWFSVYPHMALSQDVIDAFPDGGITAITLITQGNSILPVGLMQSLGYVPFRQTLLAASVLLILLGALLALFPRRGISHLAVVLGGTGVLTMLLFCFYFQALSESVLFSVLITTRWYLWVPFIASLGLFTLEILNIKGLAPLKIGDLQWRKLSAALCAVALLMLLLPFAGSTVQSGTFGTAEEDALASQNLNGIGWLTDGQPLLKELGTENGLFTNPTESGGALQ